MSSIIFTLYQLYISETDNTILHIQSPLILQQKQTPIPQKSILPLPTNNPTQNPTVKPTAKPTAKPTSKPTKPVKHDWFHKPETKITKPSELHTLSSNTPNTHPTWTVNWTLANSIHNITSHNVSSSVIWKDPNYNGYCGTQLHPILTNAQGLEYLWVHESMSIEIGTKVWIFAVDPSVYFNRDMQPQIWLGLYRSYLICAFNDGTTVVSEQIKFMRRKNLDFIIVICDIPETLRNSVLSSQANTSVGVSLFDSRNRSLNIRDNTLWMNVTIPVCSTFVINRGKHIYQSDGVKFEKLLASNDPITAKKNHFLSACLIVHPDGDKYGEMNTRIVEWIEYGKIMGVSHFYIYDHMYGREKGDKFIWDAIYYYIKHGGKVTYIEWPFPYTKPWIFQYSFINSCLNRFKYENDYISVIDIDEYLIPPKRFVTVTDLMGYINDERGRHSNMFVLKCKLSTTCEGRLGCGKQWIESDETRDGMVKYDGYFNSFLERHGCISDDRPPTNPKKYIINPMAMWYAFVHGIPRWKENVDNVAAVLTDVGICLHARDHHKAHTFYHNESVDHVIDYLKYAWKHDTQIHPLFDENREFCPQ